MDDLTDLREKIEALALVLDANVYELLNMLEGHLISEEEAGEIRSYYETEQSLG